MTRQKSEIVHFCDDVVRKNKLVKQNMGTCVDAAAGHKPESGYPAIQQQAVRNFVQLCLEGYYDNTIFHRVIKDYMACDDLS
jgi:hypothetical protein